MKMRNNNIVVIIGAGRTGSSMLTRILIALGMNGSDNYLKGTEHNPEGVFEDQDIIKVHKDIFSFIGTHPYAPVTEGFLDIQGINKFIVRLQNIIKKKIESSEAIWGFKDPRTASLLPLWSRVFNPLKIVPKYVVTLRNPSSVVTSMHRQFNDNEQISELVWLVRTCDALYYSGGHCFIVHYEDWFTDKANKLALDMAHFIDLEPSVKDDNLNKLLSNIVKKSLNRSSYETYEVKNPLVKKLYSELQKCHGEQFDRKSLMDVVIECRLAIKSFASWSDLSKNMYIDSKDDNEALTLQTEKLQDENKALTLQTEKLQDENKALTLQTEELQNDNNILVAKMNDQLKEIIELSEIIKNVKVQAKKVNLDKNSKIEALRTRDKNIGVRIKKFEKENFNLATSFPYKLGLTFVNAVKKPGKNTILFPYYFLKIIVEKIFVDKYAK